MSYQVVLSPTSGQGYKSPEVVLSIASGQSYRTPEIVLSPASGQYAAPASSTLYVYSLLGGVYTQFTPGGVYIFGETQSIQGQGFVGTYFGVGRVYNHVQYIQGIGFSGAEFGAGRVSNLLQVVNGVGFSSAVFGNGEVYNQLQYVYGVGTPLTQFGSHNVYNQLQLIHGVGSLHLRFGDSILTHTRITATCGTLTRFGAGSIGQQNRSIYGFYPLIRQWLHDAWIYEQVPMTVFGNGTVTHDTITAPGLTYTEFGQGSLQSSVQYIYGQSFNNRLFGNGSRIEYFDQRVYGTGEVYTIFGNKIIEDRFILGVGEVHFKAGYGAVSFTQITGQSIGSLAVFGSGVLSHDPQYVYGIGLASSVVFGDPLYGMMHTFDQTIYGVGTVLGKLEREDWDYRQGEYMLEIDFVTPVGNSYFVSGDGMVINE